MTAYRGKRKTAGRKLLAVLLALIAAGVVFFGAVFGIVGGGDRGLRRAGWE